MVKKFKNLVLTKDTVFNESIEVENDITCEGERWSLKVLGNIIAGDIIARNIDARNIIAWDIIARNIDARNIDAGNIIAWNIDAGIFIQNRSKLERKEW